ncbi:efflux RND transporter periplasmic adaptor subunit [Pacificimonas sp. ICDLI1SI03]
MILHRILPICLMTALLAACGSDNGGQGGGPDESAPTVVGGRVSEHGFSSAIEAVGTAFAREETVLTAPVTERIERLGFSDGDFVRRGSMIAQLSRGEEAADLAAVEARAREAQQQLGRLQELQDRGFATRSNVDTQVASRDSARADASAIRSRIEDRVIRAPFDGVIGLRTISPGAVISAGSPIATISDISSINLDFTVPEQYLSAIDEGQEIRAVAAAYPGEPFRGKIDGIDPRVDPLSRSVTVRAVLPNPDRRLRPGMLLSVDIVSQSYTAMAIPETALILQGDDSFVFQIDDEGIARRTRIETGLRSDGMIEVRDGLALGTPIVADGTVKVRDDAPVDAKMPERGSGAAACADNAATKEAVARG